MTAAGVPWFMWYSLHRAARGWLYLNRGAMIRGRRVVALARKDGGVNELGVWWDDELGSTHLELWQDVDPELANLLGRYGR